MAGIADSKYKMRLLEDLAGKDTFVHRLHPAIQVLTLLAFLVFVVSRGKYETISLLPMLFYPVVIISLGELPVLPFVKRLLVVSPLIIGIGILNPIFDQRLINTGALFISSGWLTFLSLLIKGILTVTAALLLISTTGMARLAAALRQMRVPKLFVLQLLLTYRYISVLAEEVYTLSTAYSLRAPQQRGIRAAEWGPFAGRLLLRAFDRADRIYQAMRLRGFSGEYFTGIGEQLVISDFIWVTAWVLFFVAVSSYDLPALLGALFF